MALVFLDTGWKKVRDVIALLSADGWWDQHVRATGGIRVNELVAGRECEKLCASCVSKEYKGYFSCWDEAQQLLCKLLMEQGPEFSLSPEFSSGHRYCWGSSFLLTHSSWTAWVIYRKNENVFCCIKWDLETFCLLIARYTLRLWIMKRKVQKLCALSKCFAEQPNSSAITLGLLQHHYDICLPIISSSLFLVSGPCIFYLGFNFIFLNIIFFILPSSMWFKSVTLLTLAYNIFHFVFEIQRGV